MAVIEKKAFLSFTERKRIRADYGKQKDTLIVPPLLSIQLKSYNDFLQPDAKNRLNTGLGKNYPFWMIQNPTCSAMCALHEYKFCGTCFC